MEPHDLFQAGWLDTVNGKVFRPFGGQAEQAQFSITSWSPRRWRTWCNRLKWLTTLPPRHTGQSDSQSKPRLGVTESWRENGQSLSLRRCLWVRIARRSASIGPGRQRKPPDDLELAWLEWLRAAEAARCRNHDLYGAQRSPFLGRSKGLVIEHISLGQATRKDTRRSCSKKAGAWRSLRRLVTQAVGNLAAWRNGRTSQYTTQRSVHTIASISLPDLGPWLGFSVARSPDTHLMQCSMQWGLGRPSHPGHAFHHESKGNK